MATNQKGQLSRPIRSLLHGEPGDFFLQQQFLAFHRGDLEIVTGGSVLFIDDLLRESLVLLAQLAEMGRFAHGQSSFVAIARGKLQQHFKALSP